MGGCCRSAATIFVFCLFQFHTACNDLPDSNGWFLICRTFLDILPRNIFISPWNSEKVRHFPWRSAAYPPAGAAAALGRCRRLGRHGRISPIPGSRNGLPRRRMPPDCCMKTVSFCKKRGVICQKKHFCAKKSRISLKKFTPPEFFFNFAGGRLIIFCRAYYWKFEETDEEGSLFLPFLREQYDEVGECAFFFSLFFFASSGLAGFRLCHGREELPESLPVPAVT